MYSIRKTKTGSGATAVQVVSHVNRKVVVNHHCGSAHTDTEQKTLYDLAQAWITTQTERISLFPKEVHSIVPTTLQFRGVVHSFAYDFFQHIIQRLGLDSLNSPLLLDLALMRIIEPCSKLRSMTLLQRYFGINYAQRTVYRQLPKLVTKKEQVENIAVSCAQHILHEDLSFVLYDVTTLYFESFESDELRVPGFSKDSKSQQPQIVVGLLVTNNGLPLGYEVFRGNTFEGKTMLPILESFSTKHTVQTPTVVADSAMLSEKLMKELHEKNISYIVGARLANMKANVLECIHQDLPRTDGSLLRMNRSDDYLLCSFSSKRYRKDKREMEKQIAKAKSLVEKKEPGKRSKFVSPGATETYELNTDLIAKSTRLLGIKGYVTNLSRDIASDDDIIAHYHSLWHVEQAFRMTKSDLASRPIFHYKEDSVRAHMVVCFVGLLMGKYLEIVTKQSLHSIKDLIWEVTDARIVDTSTKEEFMLRSELSVEVQKIMKLLGLSY